MRSERYGRAERVSAGSAFGGNAEGAKAWAQTMSARNQSSDEADSAPRVRLYRERRRQGLRLFTVAVPEAIVQTAVARGLLAAEDRAEPWPVIQGCYAAQLSDAALDWLIKGGVIVAEQRGDAAATLRSISKWLERAGPLDSH